MRVLVFPYEELIDIEAKLYKHGFIKDVDYEIDIPRVENYTNDLGTAIIRKKRIVRFVFNNEELVTMAKLVL